jgi:hypothetical protein
MRSTAFSAIINTGAQVLPLRLPCRDIEIRPWAVPHRLHGFNGPQNTLLDMLAGFTHEPVKTHVKTRHCDHPRGFCRSRLRSRGSVHSVKLAGGTTRFSLRLPLRLAPLRARLR